MYVGGVCPYQYFPIAYGDSVNKSGDCSFIRYSFVCFPFPAHSVRACVRPSYGCMCGTRAQESEKKRWEEKLGIVHCAW